LIFQSGLETLISIPDWKIKAQYWKTNLLFMSLLTALIQEKKKNIQAIPPPGILYYINLQISPMLTPYTLT